MIGNLPQANERLQSAIDEFSAGNRYRAIDEVGDLHEAWPGDAAIANTFGVMLVQCDRTQESLPVLRKAVAVDFLTAQYYADLAMAYLQSGDHERAHDCIVSARALDPEAEEFIKIEAFLAHKAGLDMPKALSPDDLSNFAADGSTVIDLQQAGDAVGVIEAGKEILARRPNDVRAHYCMAVALQEHNHIRSVVDHLYVVVGRMPALAGAFKGLGDLLHKAWSLKSIRAEFEVSVLGGEPAESSLDLLTDAEKAYRAAIRHQPDDAETRNYFGNLLWEMGDRDRAVEEYACAVNLEPERAAARMNYARALFETGRYESVLPEIEAALALNPNFVEACRFKARCIEASNDRIHAGEILSGAIGLSPTFSTEINF